LQISSEMREYPWMVVAYSYPLLHSIMLSVAE
jgi:hypothetical protein